LIIDHCALIIDHSAGRSGGEIGKRKGLKIARDFAPLLNHLGKTCSRHAVE